MWKGPSYPLRSGEYGLFETKSDADLIEGNIMQILGTYRGERVALPLFGSRVRDYVHDPTDDVTLRLLRVEIVDAIKMWEPRVVLLDAHLQAIPENFEVRAHLRYRFADTDEERTFSLTIDRKGGINLWRG